MSKLNEVDSIKLQFMNKYVYPYIVINLYFQLITAFNPEGSARSKIVHQIYNGITLLLLALIVYGKVKKWEFANYIALNIVVFRNILPLYDLDGIQEYYTSQNSIYLLVLQFCAMIFGLFAIGVSYQPASQLMMIIYSFSLLFGTLYSVYHLD